MSPNTVGLRKVRLKMLTLHHAGVPLLAAGHPPHRRSPAPGPQAARLWRRVLQRIWRQGGAGGDDRGVGAPRGAALGGNWERQNAAGRQLGAAECCWSNWERQNAAGRHLGAAECCWAATGAAECRRAGNWERQNAAGPTPCTGGLLHDCLLCAPHLPRPAAHGHSYGGRAPKGLHHAGLPHRPL